MKKFTEAELNVIATKVYEEIKEENGKTNDEDASLVTINLALAATARFIKKLQDEME